MFRNTHMLLFLFLLSIFHIYLSTTSLIPRNSTKRGIVDNGQTGDLDGLDIAWYYNYQEIPSRRYDEEFHGIKFIYMIKDELFSPIDFNRRPETILGFNEPDSAVSTGKMSPNEALLLWPSIEALDPLRLGAPACTRKGIDTWLPPFMQGNGTYVPRVDFVPVHWYEEDPYAMIQFLEDIRATYQLPLWVTEFAMADWYPDVPPVRTPTYITYFLNAVIPWMEKTDWIERYSHYSTNEFIFHEHIIEALWDTDGKVTEVGRAYFGLSNPPNPVPWPVKFPTRGPTAPSRAPVPVKWVSYKPSSEPTSKPTFKPTFWTRPPTRFPTVQITSKPTSIDFLVESTSMPTYWTRPPSRKPSFRLRPTLSQSPSKKPSTRRPTTLPSTRKINTATPTASFRPSLKPKISSPLKSTEPTVKPQVSKPKITIPLKSTEPSVKPLVSTPTSNVKPSWRPSKFSKRPLT